MAQKRFKQTYKQSGLVGRAIEIYTDEDTGVQYLFIEGNNNYGGGITILVDKDGKPLLDK